MVLARTTLRIYRDGYARARLMQQKLAAVAAAWSRIPL